MKKRIVSLLCVLALCLGLLPVTALAAAPQTLYVGDYQITNGSAITYLKAGSTAGSLVAGSENDWTVKYEPSTATLTLNGATIQGGTSTGSVPYGSGIYAQCSIGQSVTLTIKLIGENTITGYYGIYVNAEISADSNGTDASLTITGENNGSLEVSGSSHGIFVKSGTGNASLKIEKATVTSSTDGEYAAGVNVQSSANATGSPNISLSVNGGSLTASGSASGEGIKFYVGAFEATSATTSLTVTDNAIVDAKNGGISAKQISNPINTDISATGSNGGIVFDGKNGTVYGDVTLQEDLEIGKGETLTIPEGASLDMNGKTITVESGGKLEGTLTGSGTLKIAPTITTTTLPDGEVGTVYSQFLAANGDTPITWSLASGSTLPDGLALNESTGEITGTPSAAGEFKFTVTATNDAGSDSKEVALNVKSVPVTGVTLDKQTLELYTGDSQPLTATVQPANATNKNVTWSTSDATVATVQEGTVTAVAAGTATITVTTADGNHTATCKVTVKDPVYSMSTDTAVLSFDSKTEGYADAPAAKTVTITNTGNQPLTLAQPSSTANFEVGTLSATELPVNGTATFTVQPKTGLAAGNYEETITVAATGGQYNVATNVTVKFAVAQKSVSVSDTSTPDDSVYYTCPACGYHNWTATDAGYRCDHCGYLESVKQLSGYANVKGTYTPGSSGTTTAVTVPQTGDQSSPALWVALLSVSGLALCGLVLCRRRQH